MHKLLVLDANQRSALAIIRSLGRHGLSLIAGDHVGRTLGGASRYASSSVLYPNPAEDPGAFVREVAAIVGRHGVDTIVPATDLTTMLLASQPDSAQPATLSCPRAEIYDALTDKAALLRLADELGVLAPETRIARTAAEVEDAVRELGLPVVLKPARSRYLKRDRIISTSVEAVHLAHQFSETLRRLHWLGDIPCLVQRFVPGSGAGVFALYGRSGPIAWFAHKRIREKPPTGGVSVLCESVAIDPVMRSAATKLLSAVGWVGVAMVEFRVTDDGTPYLMEVNGRFWGSLQLAIDCGIDFPWLLYRALHGLPIEAPTGYALGRRLRWLLGDLDSTLIELKRRDARGKAEALGAFARSFVDFSCRQETFRLSDPGPAFQEASQWVKALRR